MKTKWEIVEHNWSDTSIYNQDGRLICTRCIEDECTEENQDELGEEVLRDFNLIVLLPEIYEAIEEFCMRVEKGEVRSTKTYNKFKDLLNRAKKK